MHKPCTTCAQLVHRIGIVCGMSVVVALSACVDLAGSGAQVEIPARNPTATIGAISRFEQARFDGDWRVQSSAGGAWTLTRFTVSDGGTQWREGTDQGARGGQLTPRAAGILQLTYADGTQRDLWVLWTDPDHHTLALGEPEGRFGFIATRAGRYRADQVTAAAQVLDFNGYRTREWEKVSQ